MNIPERKKDGIRVIDRRQFDQNPDNFELRVNDANAPLCRFGNRRKLIGFDKQRNEYIRFTKSVLKRLISLFEEKNVTKIF